MNGRALNISIFLHLCIVLESFSSKKNCSGNHPNVSDLPMNKNIKLDWLDIDYIKYACKLHRNRLGHRGASLIKKILRNLEKKKNVSCEGGPYIYILAPKSLKEIKVTQVIGAPPSTRDHIIKYPWRKLKNLARLNKSFRERGPYICKSYPF